MIFLGNWAKKSKKVYNFRKIELYIIERIKHEIHRYISNDHFRRTVRRSLCLMSTYDITTTIYSLAELYKNYTLSEVIKLYHTLGIKQKPSFLSNVCPFLPSKSDITFVMSSYVISCHDITKATYKKLCRATFEVIF